VVVVGHYIDNGKLTNHDHDVQQVVVDVRENVDFLLSQLSAVQFIKQVHVHE
jgi:hypothetical protein